jgi:hypothetical protein
VPDTNWKVRTVADLNGDGNPDLIWQNIATGDISVWWMNSALGLTSGELLIPGQVADLHWKIVGSHHVTGSQYDLYWHNVATGQASVWHMDGRTQISGASLNPDGVDATTGWSIRGIGDLDGNGSPDLIWQNAKAGSADYLKVAAWLMSGSNQLSGALLWPMSALPDVNWTVVVPK